MANNITSTPHTHQQYWFTLNKKMHNFLVMFSRNKSGKSLSYSIHYYTSKKVHFMLICVFNIFQLKYLRRNKKQIADIIYILLS